MYESYNPNPRHTRVGDCTVRAISKLLEQEWETTYLHLCLQGFIECDMPSSNSVWGGYLKSRGFVRDVLREPNGSECTVREFCIKNPKGRYLLALSGHVVCVVNGKYHDTWDSGDETVNYYWHNKEE